LPYWTVEDLHASDYEYEAFLERLEKKYHLNHQPYTFDADDMEYPPLWIRGIVHE
jgi:hypothetical protein